MFQANVALSNSFLQTRLRLVVTYGNTEYDDLPGNNKTNGEYLNDLIMDNNRTFSSVFSKRESVSAHVVFLIAKNVPSGKASAIGVDTKYPTAGFAVVKRKRSDWDYILTHELGHLLVSLFIY